MKTTFSAIVLAFFLLTTGFTGNPQTGVDEPGCPSLHGPFNLPLDPLNVSAVSLSGHCLTVTYSYSGGCENHRFNLVWDGVILESFPPQVNLYMQHDSNGDLCKAAIQTTLTRSLASIEDPSYSTIIVHVHGTNGSVVTFPYNY
jgi:NigD-like C-terminal beta sandwich domain